MFQTKLFRQFSSNTKNLKNNLFDIHLLIIGNSLSKLNTYLSSNLNMYFLLHHSYIFFRAICCWHNSTSLLHKPLSSTLMIFFMKRNVHTSNIGSMFSQA